jgi:hypothetical protein
MYHGADCPWGELYVGQAVRGASCPWGEMSVGRNVHGAKCPWGELSMGRTVRGANCPWGKLSVGRTVRGVNCPWGKMSVGQDVAGQIVMGQVVLGASGLGTSSTCFLWRLEWSRCAGLRGCVAQSSSYAAAACAAYPGWGLQLCDLPDRKGEPFLFTTTNSPKSSLPLA